MRAVVLTRYGAAGLQFKEVPEPNLRERDLLVEICAASLNPIDYKIQSGEVRILLPYRLPIILGNDFAGRVIKVGPLVTKFKVGDSVFGRPQKDRIGAFTERVSVDEEDCAMMPSNLTFVEAASLPLVALTAWQALFERMKLGKGQSILIHAGSGGLGSCAIQIAKAHGLHVATTTSTANVEWVKNLGADLVIDYKKERFEEHVKSFDAVLDTLGGETLTRSFQVVRKGGVVLSVSAIPTAENARELERPWWTQMLLSLASFPVRRTAAKFGVRYEFLFMHPSGQQLEQISKLVEAQKIKPIIDKTFPLDQTIEALKYLKTGRAKGKVIVNVRD